jgi:hypothetical protein
VEGHTPKPTLAGIFNITAGLMSVIAAAVLLLIGVIGSSAIGVAATEEPDIIGFAALPMALFLPIALICFITGVVAIVGGVAAINRRRLWLAIVGGIAAVLAFFPLGIAAVILTALSEKEFERT